MTRILFFALLFSFSTACQRDDSTSNVSPTIVPDEYLPRDSVTIHLKEFSIPGSTIRAMDAIDSNTVWFSGSGGLWGNTQDGGITWTTDIIEVNGVKPDFRSIKVTPNGSIYLISVQNPAAIFKSDNSGTNWTLIHEDKESSAFYDAIDFWNDSVGIVLGDPTANCFKILLTKNAGHSWETIDCINLPSATPNEYPFAASNTNLSLTENGAYFGTGGKEESRVFSTLDFGATWSVHSTPIQSGKDMTGIFSTSYYSDQKGIVAGGDWDNVQDTSNILAYTTDAGMTWKNVNGTNQKGYISCVQFVKDTEGTEIFALSGRASGGSSYMAYSADLGSKWQYFPNDNYLSIRFVNTNNAWISGKEKIALLKIR